jgi:hypothetical protein
MIQTEPEDIERIRERLCKMSDLEFRQYGRAARDLANPKKNFGPPNPSFQKTKLKTENLCQMSYK